MDTTEEVLCSKFPMTPTPTGKANSKKYEVTENTKKYFSIWYQSCFCSYTEYNHD